MQRDTCHFTTALCTRTGTVGYHLFFSLFSFFLCFFFVSPGLHGTHARMVRIIIVYGRPRIVITKSKEVYIHT